MKFHRIAGAAGILALALPAVASAHVTLQPAQAPAGAYVVESIRVPNERDDASTTQVDVELPPGFASVSYEAVPGWTVAIRTEPLDEPIEGADGEIAEEVRRVTWTAADRDAAIAPGQFRDFPLSVRMPDQPGSTLTFKALQTYSSGEVVRWIGAPDSDAPAPQVEIVAAAGDGHGASSPSTTGAGGDDAPVASDAAPVASDGGQGSAGAAAEAATSDDASKGLAIAALAAGIVGTLLGGAALVRRRR